MLQGPEELLADNEPYGRKGLWVSLNSMSGRSKSKHEIPFNGWVTTCTSLRQ